MNPCKTAYRIVRRDDNEIYKGFGFRHLSDATAYYVHRNNESYKGTTTLCQSIGEAVIFCAEFFSKVLNNKSGGEILTDESGRNIWLNLPVPVDWRANGITDVCRYRAMLDSSSIITICPLDQSSSYISSVPSELSEHYKLLPVIMLLMLRLININDEYAAMFLDFVRHPDAATFVLLHEDLYQSYKHKEYMLHCEALTTAPEDCTYSLIEKIVNICENTDAAEGTEKTEIQKFGENAFLPEYQGLIPELSDEYRLPDDLRSLCSAVAEGDMRSVLLYGPAGTGKTMSCKLICRETGLPVMETVNCTENLDEFILGKYLPEGDSIVFRESFVTKAIRFGGAVIFEEINFARPQYLAFLNSLLDDNGFVRLDSGEIVRRHENFRFFATMNIGYYGTKELNQALYNRFNAIVEINELSDEAISTMLRARVPDSEAYIGAMLEVYHRIKTKAQAEELDLVISPRNLENWARMAKYEGYLTASEKTIVPIARGERSTEEMIRKIIASHNWRKV